MIRNATIDDAPRLAHLKTRVGRDTYYHYGTPEQFDKWVEEFCSIQYFENLIKNNTTVLVAEYEDAFLGVSSVSFNDDLALFGNLYVGLQERGIGSLLTKHRFALVQSHVSLTAPGSSYGIQARCFYQNHRAYKHLLKHGFYPTSWKLHEIYSSPIVIMEQTLYNNQPVYIQSGF